MKKTNGDRLVEWVKTWTWPWIGSECFHRKLKARHDAAIKRAVKEAFWEGYGFCADTAFGSADRKKKAETNRQTFATKYGVKL